MSAWDSLWLNARLATMDGDRAYAYGAIEDAAIAVKEGRIAWLGRMADLPTSSGNASEVIDCDRNRERDVRLRRLLP